MAPSSLWICFYRQPGEVDRWALYLNSDIAAECEIWRIAGQTFEFRTVHSKGMRPEYALAYQERWLVKDQLTARQIKVLQRLANDNPADNEAEFWDSRIFCLDILGMLEIRKVLKRTDSAYRELQKRLRRKWRVDTGISAVDSSESDEEEDGDDIDSEGERKGESESECENENVPPAHKRKLETAIDAEEPSEDRGEVIKKSRTTKQCEKIVGDDKGVVNKVQAMWDHAQPGSFLQSPRV